MVQVVGLFDATFFFSKKVILLNGLVKSFDAEELRFGVLPVTLCQVIAYAKKELSVNVDKVKTHSRG